MANELSADRGLQDRLTAIGTPGAAPGAVAASGLVAAVGASVSAAGDSGQSGTDWSALVAGALRDADADTEAYWTGDPDAMATTPWAVYEAAVQVAEAGGSVPDGNRADLDSGRALAIGAAAAVLGVIAQNAAASPSPQRRTLIPAARPDAEPLLTVARAHGVYVIDDEGDRWFDAASGMWNVPLGHANAPVLAAWLEQAISVAAVDPFLTSTGVSERVAHRLTELLGAPQARVAFSSSGSEAIEIALRFALAVLPADPPVWSMPGAFHGSTAGAASLSAFPSIWGPLPARALWPRSAAPETWTAPGIAFVEPIQAVRGGLPLSAAEVGAINAFQHAGGIVVADEVASGLGRTIWPAAAPAIGLRPDITVFGKGLTNGVSPLSAVVVSKKVLDMLPIEPVLDFGHTHSNHPASLAAADATLNALSAVDFSVNARRLQRALRAHAQTFTGTGFLLAIRGSAVSRDAFAAASASARLIVHAPTTAHVVDQLVLAPPFVMSEAEADDLGARVSRMCRELRW